MQLPTTVTIHLICKGIYMEAHLFLTKITSLGSQESNVHKIVIIVHSIRSSSHDLTSILFKSKLDDEYYLSLIRVVHANKVDS